MNFNELNLDPRLLQGIEDRGYKEMTVVQENTLYRLSKKLQYNGFRSRHLTGEIPQRQRLRIIDDFMAGKFPLLVATDVAARGLQIDNLDMVINYDLPLDCENYVHRIGRTARAGNSGKAISLASEGTAKQLDAIESFMGMKIPVLEANIDNFTRDKSQELESQRYARNRPKHHRAGIHPRNIKRYA